MKNKHFILASQSPRRKQLLEWAEIPFEVMISDADESFPGTLPVDEVPVYIARNKALAVQQSIPNNKGQIIIAADTIVVLNEEVIGKPKNREDAISILQKLSSNSHKVITGVVILSGEKQVAFADTTEVPLTFQVTV